MARSIPRILAYLALAIVCYFIAMSLGPRTAALVFFLLGGFLELLFWKNLLFPNRGGSEGSNVG
jgi:hypothetical protein